MQRSPELGLDGIDGLDNVLQLIVTGCQLVDVKTGHYLAGNIAGDRVDLVEKTPEQEKPDQ